MMNETQYTMTVRANEDGGNSEWEFILNIRGTFDDSTHAVTAVLNLLYELHNEDSVRFPHNWYEITSCHKGERVTDNMTIF